MKVWVLSTCVPGDPKPCWPSVFTTVEAANVAFAEAMRNEWDAAEPEDDDGNALPLPDNPNEAQDFLKTYCGPGWGEWEITPHEIDVPVAPTMIPENKHGVKPGFYTRPDLSNLLKKNVGNPAAVFFIANCMYKEPGQ